MVNEIAPRVHNSGHWTQDACLIDQFEQHVRAICGWPLGDGSRHSDAVMTNLIGDDVAGRRRSPAPRVHSTARARRGPGARWATSPASPALVVTGPRLAVRAVILDAGRVLLVNAYPGEESDLWCAPGGGVERGHEPARQPAARGCEETGLAVEPGRLLAVSEFHNPDAGFHQVDLNYAARLLGAAAPRCSATSRGW